MAAIHKKGRDHLEALREAHRAESERLLGVFGDVLSAVREATAADGHGVAAGDDAEEAAGRLVLKTLERAGGVEALSAAREAVSAHHGGNYLPLLDRHYRSLRSALFTWWTRSSWNRPARSAASSTPSRTCGNCGTPKPPTCPSAWKPGA